MGRDKSDGIYGDGEPMSSRTALWSVIAKQKKLSVQIVKESTWQSIITCWV